MVAADVFLMLSSATSRSLMTTVTMDGRSLVIPPSVRNTIMGIDRYVFCNGQAVNSGLIGNLYGVDIYVSANCRTIEAAADNTASSIDTRAALLFHTDAIVMACAGCTFTDSVQAGIPLNSIHS